MAITLITPRQQWIAGATVQFKCDEYGDGVKDYIYSGPPAYTWYWVLRDVWHTVLLGYGTLIDGNASTKYIRPLWTQAQIDLFLSVTSKEIGYSTESFAGTALGYYIEHLPQVVAAFGVDPYATVVSTDPNVKPGAGGTTPSGAGTYYYLMKRKTWRYLTIYVYDLAGNLVGLGGPVLIQQIYSSGLVLTSAQTDAYIAEHPLTSEHIVENRPGGFGAWSDPALYVSKWVGYLDIDYFRGDAMVGTPNFAYSLASREVTVTLQLKQNLPAGGLYIFAPIIGRSFSGGYPTWTPYGWVPGAGGFLSIVGHEKLLVWPDEPEWLPGKTEEILTDIDPGSGVFCEFQDPVRLPGYNPDFFWNDGEWKALDELAGAGGGRYNRQLVAVGHQVVYVEEYI